MIKIVGKIDLDALNKRGKKLPDLTLLFSEDEDASLTKDKKDRLYQVFKRDIIQNPPLINGNALTYNKNKSKHPDFRNLPEGFVHCITRKNTYTGKREFDWERAQKLHWIKPIIENVDNLKIKYFENTNDKGKNQKYYWYEDKDFIIIIREVRPNQVLITAFNVDSLEKRTYRNKYQKYLNR